MHNVDKGEKVDEYKLFSVNNVGYKLDKGWARMSRWFVFLFIVALFFSNSVYADDSQRKHVAIIVVPSLSFREIPLLVDETSPLWQDVAFGAMNVRPNGPYSYLNNIVTIASGEKALGVEGWNSFEIDETFFENDVIDWMRQIGGKVEEVEATTLYHPYFHRLNERNNGLIGRLGQLLHDAGVKRFVYGHSDAGEERVRFASLIAIDETGTVNGRLREAVRTNPLAPYGMEMDIDYLIEEISRSDTSSRLTVVEWGDLYRLFKQRPYIDDGHFFTVRENALKRLRSFLYRAQNAVDEMWVVAPMMHEEAYREKQLLAPILYWGKGSGYLTSPTTRQRFIVTNRDFVPTIAAAFGVGVDERWTGQPIVKVDGDVRCQEFFAEIEHIFFVYKTRAPVLSTYIICLVIALIAVALLYFFGKRRRPVLKFIIRLLLLSSLATPVFILLLANVKMTVAAFVFVLLLASCLTGFLTEKLGREAIFVLGLITFFAISIDLLLETPLMKRSYLGYDPIIGARYYGIGNEFAGFYIISALMLAYPFLQREKKLLPFVTTGLVSVALVFFLGKSTLGTNAGATLSALIAFSYLFYKLLDRRLSLKMTIAASFVIAAIGVILLYLLQLNGETSHIGLAFERLFQGDVNYIFELIKRKIEMNVKLFRYSNWTQLFVTSYVLAAIIVWRKQHRLGDREQQLFLQAGVIASFALLILNDSGVVASATSMFFVIATYFYWLANG